MEGGFRGTPKGGVYTPPINLEVFFTHILATATRLNTSYGLETLHAQLSRHVGITQKVLRHIRHFWRIYDVINVGFFRHFAVFCYRKCHKVCRNSSFSHRICVLIGSTTLPSSEWAFWCTLNKLGGGKITPPQSKIFKNDPKKLKLTPKLEYIKIFPKHKEKICSDPYFWWCQHFFGKK